MRCPLPGQVMTDVVAVDRVAPAAMRHRHLFRLQHLRREDPLGLKRQTNKCNPPRGDLHPRRFILCLSVGGSVVCGHGLNTHMKSACKPDASIGTKTSPSWRTLGGLAWLNSFLADV